MDFQNQNKSIDVNTLIFKLKDPLTKALIKSQMFISNQLLSAVNAY